MNTKHSLSSNKIYVSKWHPAKNGPGGEGEGTWLSALSPLTHSPATADKSPTTLMGSASFVCQFDTR